MSIAWSKGLSWDSLMRIARGIDDDGSDGGRDGGWDRFVKMPAFVQPVDWLPRRADRHPDAPPRLPIAASRDLPALESAERAYDATPHPLPRSPEPWSQAQLDSLLESLALTAIKPSEQSGKR